MVKRSGRKPDSASNFRFTPPSYLGLTELRLVVSDRKHVGGQTKQTRVSHRGFTQRISQKQGIENLKFVISPTKNGKGNTTSVALW